MLYCLNVVTKIGGTYYVNQYLQCGLGKNVKSQCFTKKKSN